MFDSRIAGIPCQIKVTYAQKGHSARIYGDPNDCYEACGDEFEFEVYDRKGYRAKWLEKKLTDSDHEKIMNDYTEDCQSALEP